jgi:multiple antibiotic resistance protein
MLVALVLGRGLLDFFGISIEAFRIAGGLLLGVSGMNMLNSKPDDEDQPAKANTYSKVISLAVIPIAIPLTTGAGTFSTIIIFADEVGYNWLEFGLLVAAILVITAAIYFIFKYSMKLLDVLGHTGMNVLIKVVGLFTLALGTQFILMGISAAFPALGIK